MKTYYDTTSAKELVSLRKRATSDGGYSLYLDYSIEGIRKREFLKMYLVPERNKIDTLQNQETLRAANLIKTRKIVDIQSGKAGIEKKTKNIPLWSFVDSQVEYYKKEGKLEYAKNVNKIGNWLRKYNQPTMLASVDKNYIMKFVRFMRDKKLSPGTVHMYFVNFNVILNNAYRQGLITDNPYRKIERRLHPPRPESEREYLTLDEVKILADTRCGNEAVKRAFLFSCFTGLRLSDIMRLTWAQIKRSGNGWQIEERQKKTGRLVYIPLSDNAKQWLPEKAREGLVFTGFPHQTVMGADIKRWVKSAKIDKHISFHCARHTFATLLLTYGTDIYTVSSLLGHTDLSTTQIYAKVINEKKRNAVSKIPNIL